MADEFLLPHEIFGRVGIPESMRVEVAYHLLSAKFCAYVEAVVKATDGMSIEIDLDRVREISDLTHLSDPKESVMVVERPAGDGVFAIGLATVDEIRAANRRYALARMGARRN